MKLLNGFLSGKERLWKAFLILGLFVNFIIGFIFALTAQIISNHLLLQFVAGISLIIVIVAWIGQWRCAFNTKYYFLGILLRTWLLLCAFVFIGKLLPNLPSWLNSILGLVIIGLFIFIISYYLITPVKDYVQLVIYKRKNPEK